METPNSNLNIEKELFTFQEVLDNVNKEILIVTKYQNHEELKKCTYEKGYITQELYSCATCNNDKKEDAGICNGCAHTCHKDHELNPLFFKRDFRCDCGNSKFSTISIILFYF